MTFLQSEKKFIESKVEDNEQVNELKDKIKVLSNENKELTVNLRESHTQISILKTEVAELKLICNEKEHLRTENADNTHEINQLKREIIVLQ